MSPSSPPKHLRFASLASALVLTAITIAVTIAIAIASAPGARADVLDPSMPRTLRVGAPRGAAPSERLDAQRSGRARTLFPSAPLHRWEHHLASGLELSPVVDENDNILVVGTTPEVLKLDPEGNEVWRARFSSPAVASPVLTSDGTLVLVTAAGQAVGVTPSGSIRFVSALGVRGRDADTPPLALEDGGVIIAAGGSLVEIDRDGAVRARTALEIKPGTADTRVIGALVQGPAAEGALFTTESGSVFAWRPPSAPRRLGGFGGFPGRGAVVTGARTLTAIVDKRRVVDFDLPTGVTHVRLNTGAGASVDGPVTIGLGGALLVATPTGLLVGVDAAGNETLRIALEKPPANPPPVVGPTPAPPIPGGSGMFATPPSSAGSGFFSAPAEIKSSPAPIVDRQGRIAFVRASGSAGVVNPKGAVVLASDRVCGSPITVLPAGDKRLLIACRDGGLWLYGE